MVGSFVRPGPVVKLDVSRKSNIFRQGLILPINFAL